MPLKVHVGPIGPKDAKIVFIGEAPGDEEICFGEPFVGPAGKQLDSQFRHVGIDRDSVYITNIVKRKIYKNDFTTMFTDASMTKPTPELQEWYNMLDAELDQLKPNIIVPLGRQAMYYATGHDSIEKWRGSIIQDKKGRKVVGTYHPSYILRGQWGKRPTVLMDLRRIKAESQHPLIRLPKREFIIAPTFSQVMEYIEAARKAPYCSTDIEVQWYKYVSCIGLSYDPSHAISIPFIKGFAPYWSREHYLAIKKALDRLFREGRIVGQNFHFDWCWLSVMEGFDDINLTFDTFVGQHAAWPELPRSLAYQASIYTREPFWKDEAKEADPDNKAHTNVKDYPKYWTYNCKDAAVTGEIMFRLEVEIDRNEQREIFEREMAYIPEFVKLTLRGFNFDEELRDKLKREVKSDLRKLNNTLDDKLPVTWVCSKCKGKKTLRKRSKEPRLRPHKSTLCPVCKEKDGKKWVAWGCPICEFSGKKMEYKLVMEDVKCPDCHGSGTHLNPDSPYQVKKLIYDHMKLPKQLKKDSNKTTVERLALLKLQANRPNPVFQTLLDYSEKSQELKLLKAKLGPDHRMHTTLACNTNTGRLSSSSSPFGHGINMQNVKRHGDFRKMYLADPGFILVAADYEKAEAYTMGYEAADYVYIEALENCHKCRGATGIIDPNCPICHGTGRGDIHTKNATIVFMKDWEDVVKDERQIGKRCSHGFNYEMGMGTVCDYILLDLGPKYAITQKQAKMFRANYFDTYKGLGKFQDFVKEEVKRIHTIWNSFGRRHQYLGNCTEAKTFREAIAFIPQSTIADLTNTSYLKVAKHDILGPQILLQKHDELVVQVREPGYSGNQAFEQNKADLIELMTMEITARYSGLKYTVPVEIKTGRSLGELE